MHEGIVPVNNTWFWYNVTICAALRMQLQNPRPSVTIKTPLIPALRPRASRKGLNAAQWCLYMDAMFSSGRFNNMSPTKYIILVLFKLNLVLIVYVGIYLWCTFNSFYYFFYFFIDQILAFVDCGFTLQQIEDELKENLLRRTLLDYPYGEAHVEDTILFLISNGAKLEGEAIRENSNLILCLQKRLFQATESLIENGVNVNHIGENGETALHIACQKIGLS